ncbi:uncharacterized protein LOC129299137 [Prosopis cineraria]|uniref:uncharacterized protein LOC129299137 n=1 Tax=Prosopis cineraria TaxID=364024 RepID=UPI00240F6659|nr:uncharacterized protein LOC129299137 [Prosopis cineraria]
MDKSKGRTDLLAAGRKKFQQFRQKKDSKGGSGHGKSSKKSVKAGNMSLTLKKLLVALCQQHHLRLPMVTLKVMQIPISVSKRFQNQSLWRSRSLLTSVLHLLIHHQQLIMTQVFNCNWLLLQLALQAQVVDEHDSAMLVQNEEESIKDVGIDMLEDVPLGTFHGPVSEDGKRLTICQVLVDTLPVPAPVTTAAGKSSRVERECRDAEESLLLSEDIPNTSSQLKMEVKVLKMLALKW